MAKGREEGTGIRARKMADGRCVKTMVWTLPNRLAIEEARSIDIAEIIAVAKNKEPSLPSPKPNLSWKK